MLEIDRLAYESRFQHLNLHVRIGLPMLWLLFSQLLDMPLLYRTTFFIAALATLWHRVVPVRLYLKALLAPAFFVVTAVLGILWVTVPGQSEVILSAFLGGQSFYMTQASLSTAVHTLERSFSSVSLVYFIAFNVPIWELGWYMKRMRVPVAFVEVFILCYRFVFILLEEATEMAEAQTLRLGYRTLETSFKSLSLLLSQLLIRSILKAKAMEDSLALRLSDGTFHLD